MNATENVTEKLIETAAEKLRAGLFEDAIDGFTSVISLEPSHAKALQGRGTARFQVKDWTGAEKDFLAARLLDPQEPENWMGLALSMAVQNRVYLAIDVYNELLSRFPGYVPALIQLGMLHFKIGAINKGRDFLQDALNRRPTLVQRRLIESQLAAQSELDKKRFYRPDFEKLKTNDISSQASRWFRRFIQSIVGR